MLQPPGYVPRIAVIMNEEKQIQNRDEDGNPSKSVGSGPSETRGSSTPSPASEKNQRSSFPDISPDASAEEASGEMEAFWQGLQEAQKIEAELIQEAGETDSQAHALVPLTSEGDKHPDGGSPARPHWQPEEDLMPRSGTAEQPRAYFSESEAFHELKRKYGIRNRFWRKNYKRLKPGLNRLYDEAVISRYRPLTQALLVANEQTDGVFRDRIYALRFTELFQETRRLGPLYLQPGQTCQFPRKKSRNDEGASGVDGPVLLNPDGSPDLELREQVLAYFDRGKQLLQERLSELELKERMKAMIGKFEEPPEGAPISKMMNSTWMKVLSQLVPGFPLLGLILSEMDGGRGVDWKKLGSRVMGRAARDGAQIGLKRLLRSIRAPGAFLPVSFLLEQGMDRSELLAYLSVRVERKKKQLQHMAHPKKHL